MKETILLAVQTGGRTLGKFVMYGFERKESKHGIRLTMFVSKQQVNYENDNEWGQWTMSAKRRILMDTTSSRTGAPYFINQNVSEGPATLVSSLSSTVRSSVASNPATTTCTGDIAQWKERHWEIGRANQNGKVNRMVNETNDRLKYYAEGVGNENSKSSNSLNWSDDDMISNGQGETDEWLESGTEKNGGVNDWWMTSKWGDGRDTTGNEGDEAMRNQKESSEGNKKKV